VITSDRTIDGNDWSTYASCKDAEYPEDFDFKSKSMNDVALNERAIATYCRTCPVVKHCLDFATMDDRMESIRGGILPGKLTLVPSPVRKYQLPSEEQGAFMINRGECMGQTVRHPILTVNDLVFWKGSTRCLQCTKATADQFTARRSAARKAARLSANISV
jgi:hypothetical protein